ncbi:hypothetical protein [Clostridium tagluense]|uniref:hypothetical protein n=1 Tax=Clostridium tagluense TaxID=360422 RepID=UPI001CF51742|nr:hypothetical protein [Clostridium tagluense]MCB2300274.1 hypothetical protein [Clostridium tagluense]
MDNSKMKIGARILSEVALKKLLPSNHDIDNQILSIRKSAGSYNLIKESNKDNEIWDREFDRHFNNIFSILGGRGSGKTSVLLTMKYKIMNEYSKADIILPLIVPEKIGTTGSLLECIMGLLGDVVDKIENDRKNSQSSKWSNSESCRKQDGSRLVEKYNELLKQYTYTQIDYKQILINQYEGFKDYIDNIKNILDSDQKLIVKFEEFIEELLKEKRKLNQEKNNEPIIFIFFDDVDLSTGRCTEVLNIILRYLSHPNIVVFVAGNYKTFSEVITINTLNNDKLLNEQMEKCFFSETIIDSETALDTRKILTQDFLKKILPPAFRYYMPVMSEKEKAEFIFSTEEDNYNYEISNNFDEKIIQESSYFSLYELIKEIFIDSNYNEKKDMDIYKNNFLKYNNKELIYAYFKIFDDTQRGTMNVYYFLYSLLNSKFNSENQENERCLHLKRFLNIIVQSSSILNKYENEIYRIIDIKDSFEDVFIDYRYIENMIDNISDTIYKSEISKTNNGRSSSIDDLIKIFILANFIENIVVEENKKVNLKSKRKVHGANVLFKILNSQNKHFILYPKVEDTQMLLQMYTLVSMRISSSNIKTLSDKGEKDYFLGKYYEILDEVIEQTGNSQEFFWKIYRKDPTWVDHKIRIIMYYGAGDIIFLINNSRQAYEKVKEMGIDEVYLQDMRKELDELTDQFKENHANTKFMKNQLKISISIEKDLIEKQVISHLDVKEKNENYFEKLIDYYEDRILFYENKFSREKTGYKITQKIKKDFEDNIEKILEESSRYENLRNADLYNLDKLKSIDFLNANYLSSEEYEILKKILGSIRIRSGRMEEAVQDLNGLLKYIELNGLKIRSEYISDINELFNNLTADYINYIKVKTLMEIINKEEEKFEDESSKTKDSFYKKFTRLRMELKDSVNKKSALGFKQHIEEMEKESMKVDFDV